MTYDIGDAAALKSKFADSAWEGDEQSGANEASEETLRQLSQLNKDYLDKQGFIFLICATGMSAAEMVVALQARMPNDSGAALQPCMDIYRM
jgi:2-oxo-4-hydroxy-4-carboxy-5-ureidoimidazoline decarboxylase